MSDIKRSRHRKIYATSFAMLLIAVVALVSGVTQTFAQTNRTRISNVKLPSPEKVVGDYLRAVGGKKRVASVRDASYEWRAAEGASIITRRTQIKSPAARRVTIIAPEGESSSAVTPRTAWTRESSGGVRTLTDTDANVARLQAVLEARRFADYKKQKVLARTVGIETIGGESAYIIEFTAQNGARLRYAFSRASKFLVQAQDDTRGITTTYADYRREGELLEPHRVEVVEREGAPQIFALQSVARNTNLSDRAFDPPVTEQVDVAALLTEIARNQLQVDERVKQYTFMQRETERELNNRGELKKETVKVYEVYPVPGREPVFKLVSENGVAVSEEKAKKESERAAEELEKAERESEKDKLKAEEKKAKRIAEAAKKQANEKDGGAAVASEVEDSRTWASVALRVCEFVAPRRERFRDRDAIVFDFRARKNFKPQNRTESIIGKLNGILWIDPNDKQLMRFEARFAEPYKIAGGLLAQIKPGSALVVEQTRLPDGVWLPRFAQLNASYKLFLFAGGDINVTQEWSDYKKFSTEADKDNLDAVTAQP
ncbi:MAG: hypothetical protein MSG64_16075 [Pyrinomonadaceae bacterium MAG19_C2-C3]|nr:hypothetical protein [Pyrinomonadaceae bacterium MAG19_C2-C3]